MKKRKIVFVAAIATMVVIAAGFIRIGYIFRHFPRYFKETMVTYQIYGLLPKYALRTKNRILYPYYYDYKSCCYPEDMDNGEYYIFPYSKENAIVYKMTEEISVYYQLTKYITDDEVSLLKEYKGSSLLDIMRSLKSVPIFMKTSVYMDYDSPSQYNGTAYQTFFYPMKHDGNVSPYIMLLRFDEAYKLIEAEKKPISRFFEGE